ncbi:MAG: hypothetical protein BWY11_00971 [Firmicutes bacterium ADurb.Bin182]|nr:MAG: hypothetical protein BWY11_00971 [Firmicutes bacterium ADurb.Bin182]
MAVAVRQEAREYYAARVYSRSAAYAEPVIDPYIPGEPSPDPGISVKTERKAQLQKKRRLLMRFVSVCGVLAVLSALLIVMVGYERIAGEYAAVNTLKADIEQTRLNLEALNVSLQYAVSLDKASAAALQLGMDYPAAGQIVRVSGTNADTSLNETD